MRGPQVVVLGIIVFAGATAAVGAIAGPPLPVSEWAVPEARIGDRGLYTVAMFDEHGVIMEERPWQRFTWAEPTVEHDFDGDAHWTNTLVLETARRGASDGYWHPSMLSVTHHLETGSWDHVATDQTLANEIDEERGRLRFESESQHVGDEYKDRTFQCGLISPVQGSTINLRWPVTLHNDCSVPFGVIWTPGWLEYRAVAIEEIDGEDAVRFRGEHAPNDFVVDYWYMDLPYPVRLATYLPNGTTVVTTLREFERGEGELAEPAAAPDMQPLPPLQMAPRQPWGLDESGIDHPFPASLAWRVARDAPGWPDLRDALADDPRTAAAAAWYDEHRSTRNGETTIIRSWQFEVPADPPLLFTVWDRPHEPEKLPIVDQSLPEDDPPARNRTVEHHQDRQMDERRWNATADIELPTVASLWAQWKAQRGPQFVDLQPNAWQMDVLSWDGVGIDRRVAGGVDLTTATYETVASENVLFPPRDVEVASNRWRSEVSIDNPTSLIYQRRAVSETWDAEGQAVPAPPASVEDEGVPMQLTVSPWNIPSLPWWIGSGIVALMVAGLAWTWPVVKPGLWGLFSRHSDRDEVLEDPTRRRIVELVESQPGIHLRALSKEVGLSRSATRHHTQKLAAFGLVVDRREGQYLAFYPPGRRVHAPAVRSQGAQAIVQALEGGPLDARSLADAAGLSLSTTYHHIDRLRQDGVVVKAGRQVHLA